MQRHLQNELSGTISLNLQCIQDFGQISILKDNIHHGTHNLSYFPSLFHSPFLSILSPCQRFGTAHDFEHLLGYGRLTLLVKLQC